MAGRKIRSEADARACLTAAKAAGSANLALWAREHRIDGRSLNAWRVNLERGAAARKPRLVELLPAAALTARTAPQYLVRCGELTVEVDGSFDEATLGRLLRVVLAC